MTYEQIEKAVRSAILAPLDSVQNRDWKRKTEDLIVLLFEQQVRIAHLEDRLLEQEDEPDEDEDQ